jgi:hypothetical protein
VAAALYEDDPVLYALAAPTPGVSGLTTGITAGWSAAGQVWLAAGPQLYAWDSDRFVPRVIDSSLDAAANLEVARVVVTGDDDAWAVGMRQRARDLHLSPIDNFVAHRDPDGRWRIVEAVPAFDEREGFLDAGASGPDDVWAVGAGIAVHWDGVAWTRTPLPEGAEPSAIVVRTSAEAWLAAGPIGVLSWDGARWAVAAQPDGAVRALADARDELWAAWEPRPGVVQVARGDGTKWTTVAAQAEITAATRLWVVGPDDIWLEGYDQGETRLLRWSGGAWHDVAAPRYARIAASADGDMWVLAGSEVAHWNGADWRRVPTPIAATWAAGDRGVLWIGDGIRVLRLADPMRSALSAQARSIRTSWAR